MVELNQTGVSPEVIGKLAPLFGSQDNMIIFSAIVFGLGMRTVYRYYQEKKAGNPDAQQFDSKFFYYALIAFIGAGIPALQFMPLATATFNAFVPQWGIVFSWIFTAMGIYTANAAVNAGAKLIENKAVTQAITSGKFDDVIDQKVQARLQEKENNEQSFNGNKPGE